MDNNVTIQFELSIKYISHIEAKNIEEELLNKYKFSDAQLLELFGLGVAEAVSDAYPLKDVPRRPLIVSGPGINGGIGFVCARHLKHYGYSPVVYIHRKIIRPLFIDLCTQSEKMEIPHINILPNSDTINRDFDFVVDALYGYNFKPPIRPDSLGVVNILKGVSIPVCSVDIPSGWDPDDIYQKVDGLQPHILISIVSPKLCALGFRGEKHYLTGKFIPQELQEKFKLNLPDYPTKSLCVELNAEPS